MNLIPILSLIIALFALFVGPLISSRSAKRAMLGPMRQKWIIDLRTIIAEIASSCLYYFQTGFEDRSETEYKKICDLEHQFLFMINPNEVGHQNLTKVIRSMINALEKGKEGDTTFISSYESLLTEGRNVLKNEWKVIKKS